MLAKTALTIVALGMLHGCANNPADRFAERVISYNTELEAAQTGALLLNVMRATYRQPLQFADMTSISGIASAQATVGASLPFAGNRGTGAQLYSVTPALSISGGPTFAVGVLNTQDFYKGILSPVSPQIVNWYIQAGLPPSVLLTLFLNKIETATSGGVAGEWRNDFDPVDAGTPTEHLHYDDFAKALKDLLLLGLTMEITSEKKEIGPRLDDADAKKLLATRDLDAQQLQLERRQCAPGDKTAPCGAGGSSSYFQLSRTVSRSRFCFNRIGPASDVSDESGPSAHATTTSKCAVSRPAAESSSVVRATRVIPGGEVKQPNQEAFTLEVNGAPTTYYLTLRSVEQIIYYLGQLARYELDLGPTSTRLKPVFPCTHALELEIAPQRCVKLFTVSRAPMTPSMKVSYLGEDFYAPISSKGIDRSGQVMEIATQLLNLNKSGKDFPAPSIISVLER